MLALKLVGRRRRLWGRSRSNSLAAFFVCGVVDGQECEALWNHGLLVVDEALLDRARVVEALGETFYMRPPGVEVSCRVDTRDPLALMSTLVRALDHLHDARAVLAKEPDTWQPWDMTPVEWDPVPTRCREGRVPPPHRA